MTDALRMEPGDGPHKVEFTGRLLYFSSPKRKEIRTYSFLDGKSQMLVTEFELEIKWFNRAQSVLVYAVVQGRDVYYKTLDLKTKEALLLTKTGYFSIVVISMSDYIGFREEDGEHIVEYVRDGSVVYSNRDGIIQPAAFDYETNTLVALIRDDGKYKYGVFRVRYR